MTRLWPLTTKTVFILHSSWAFEQWMKIFCYFWNLTEPHRSAYLGHVSSRIVHSSASTIHSCIPTAYDKASWGLKLRILFNTSFCLLVCLFSFPFSLHRKFKKLSSIGLKNFAHCFQWSFRITESKNNEKWKGPPKVTGLEKGIKS